MNNNIFLIGPMGAGKSTIGKQLALRLKMEFFDSDQVIEERAGTDLNWIFDIEGAEGLRLREAKVLDGLTQKQGIVLATGGGSVELAENRTLLAQRGLVIYLSVPLTNQLDRTRQDKKRPLLQCADPEAVLRELADSRAALYEEIADLHISTVEKNARVVVHKIMQHLAQHDE